MGDRKEYRETNARLTLSLPPRLPAISSLQASSKQWPHVVCARASYVMDDDAVVPSQFRITG